MFIIGERLNSTRRVVREALLDKDIDFLLLEAKKQLDRGVSALDLNAATLFEGEREALRWAITLLQDHFSIPISIDTPNRAAMEAGLKSHRGHAVLNSLTGEAKRLSDFLPLIKEYRPMTIILCMDDNGLPQTPEEELAAATKLVDLMDREGVDLQDIFLDPLVRPIGADPQSGPLFLESLSLIKDRYPDIKTIAGISNVSFGLPRRNLINRTLLTLAMGRGLDAAICNPLDAGLVAALRTGEALLGRDPMLRNYLSFIRSEDR
jgi:cobalamin-dependent methionine synthase I